jgi:hypothetical protein
VNELFYEIGNLFILLNVERLFLFFSWINYWGFQL